MSLSFQNSLFQLCYFYAGSQVHVVQDVIQEKFSNKDIGSF